LRIGFDVTPLVSRGSGVARYTIELLRALRDSSTDLELTLLSNRAIADEETSAELEGLARIDTPDFRSRQIWMQAVLPRALTHDHVDVCHFTNFDAPLVRSVPAVVTLHDMSLLIAPHLHPARRVLMLTPLMRLAAGRAEAVVCPTRSARRDAITHLHLDPERVHVLSGSVAPIFRTLDDAASRQAVCHRYGLQPGFVLFVGTIEPRKNLVRLARAYSRLRRSGFDGQLVICGGWGWKSADLRPRIERMGISNSVVFTGYVPDEDVVALLNAAGAFVYPSLYEGFGLPIVEAFASGVPVVTSDRGAMAEVAGDAALLVDPTSTEQLTDALRRALTDSAERARLRAAGLARASEFNRARTAREAIATYRAVLPR
jgi:glycosyltransferase involved in cell wall biosynthesis